MKLAIILCLTILFSSIAVAQTTQPASQSSDNRRSDPYEKTYESLKPELPTLWLCGDSTVRNGQDTGNNGQWGWGNPIKHYFDATKINVANVGMGGTSSRTYYRDIWPGVKEHVKPGDFIIIELGTNDGGKINEPPGPSARARASLKGNGEEIEEIDNQLTNKHEVVHTYGWYLRKIITEAKEKGAVEFYISSTTVRNDWKEGKLGRNGYNATSEEAAKQAGAFYIPLNQTTAEKFEAIGEEKVKSTYYPDNEKVHPGWDGAVFHAEVILDTIKTFENSKLKQYILAEYPKDLKNPTGKPR